MTTSVVLIRHAKPAPSASVDDFSRILSEEGKSTQAHMDAFLRHKGLIPDAIWHSPFKRAEETASIIGKDFGVTPMEELSLGEYFDEDDLLQKLPDPKKKLCIFLVGHGPQLMRLATYFVGRPCVGSSPTPSTAILLEFRTKIAAGEALCVKIYSPEVDLPGFLRSVRGDATA